MQFALQISPLYTVPYYHLLLIYIDAKDASWCLVVKPKVSKFDIEVKKLGFGLGFF